MESGCFFKIGKTKACLYCERKEPKERERERKRVREDDCGCKGDQEMGWDPWGSRRVTKDEKLLHLSQRRRHQL